MPTFVWVFIFALAAMVVNSLGIYLMYRNQAWVHKHVHFFMCFAAGVLIASPLIMLFPEALEKNEYAGFAALVGFVFMFFSNKWLKHKTKQDSLAFGITAIQGIGIHSFMDGIIYAVTFSVSTLVGVVAGLGLVMHELAEGAITFSVLSKSNMKPKKAFGYAFIVAALTTPIGALIGYPLVNLLNDAWLGLALGFVVGVLIYVSASHLLPEAREHEHTHSQLAFLGGILLAFLLFFVHHH